MKLLPLFALLATLCVGCPKEKAPTTMVDPAATMTAYAILIADAEGVSPPTDVRIEASAGAGTLLLVEAPALLVDRPPEGWRRWTRIGDAAARARLGAADWLLASAADGRESTLVSLMLTPDGAADPEIRVKLQSSGVAVKSIEGGTVSATVPRGAWGALLKMTQLKAVQAPAPAPAPAP